MLVSILLSLSGVSLTDGFLLPAASRLVAASSSSPTFCAGGRISGSGMSASAEDQLGSTTVNMDHYDIVKVDLADGRDYPIYIGTEYSDEEGEFICVCVVAFFFLATSGWLGRCRNILPRQTMLRNGEVAENLRETQQQRWQPREACLLPRTLFWKAGRRAGARLQFLDEYHSRVLSQFRFRSKKLPTYCSRTCTGARCW